MVAGMFLFISGGWLIFLLIYRGVFPGFMYGLYMFLINSNVRAKKFTILTFTSIVIDKFISFNVLHIAKLS